MNFYIQQNISINLLRIDAITNSSVLQIGSAGVIRPTAHLYNTGGFTGPAPEPIHPGGTIVTTQDSAEFTGSDTGSYIDSPAVPLSIS
ncbi:spore germination protein GerPB [Robertmurraya sp. GLU-23]